MKYLAFLTLIALTACSSAQINAATPAPSLFAKGFPQSSLLEMSSSEDDSALPAFLITVIGETSSTGTTR
jgi:hypothetical protein